LSLIRGGLEAILDSVYPPELGSIVPIHEHSLVLGRLLDDLRSLASLDAGELAFVQDVIEARLLIDRSVRQFRTEADMKEIQLAGDPSPGNELVSADPARINQVLGNLLSNALRHTPERGCISVRSSAKIDLGGNDVVEFSIEDTGEGMTPEDCAHVFDRFYRADASRTASTGGSGLGLAISRTIVEAHHGTIGVESTPGLGSRFWFTLPRAAPGKPLILS
jgi:two-component system sensor histidine kinase BaeS